uniref:IgLON family member 5 n=1 Tax=Fundulus heteroclitus TaxID=8078 RepID=A0A3Q2QZW1_FUNHE
MHCVTACKLASDLPQRYLSRSYQLNMTTSEVLPPFNRSLSSHRCRIDEEVTHKAWLNRSNILFTGTDKWSLDKRVTLVNTSNREFSILIDKVQVADEGPYTCTFQANNKPRITHVYLIVQVPARIVNISKSVSLNEGESVTLYCLAVGRPEPTVTWRNQKYRGWVWCGGVQGCGRAQRNSKKLLAICPHYSEAAGKNCREGILEKSLSRMENVCVRVCLRASSHEEAED